MNENAIARKEFLKKSWKNIAIGVLFATTLGASSAAYVAETNNSAEAIEAKAKLTEKQGEKAKDDADARKTVLEAEVKAKEAEAKAWAKAQKEAYDAWKKAYDVWHQENYKCSNGFLWTKGECKLIPNPTAPPALPGPPEAPAPN